MTKKYNSAMLQIVSINKNDIITGSNEFGSNGEYSNSVNLAAPDRMDNDWDAGY